MKCKSVWLGCLGAIVALLGLIHANGLLATKAVSGTDFVWLTAAYLAVGLLIAILPKVTELTFSNLTLKIAAAEQAAAITLEQLNRALEHSFAPALATVTDFSGVFSDLGPKDERLAKFFALAEAIEKAGFRGRYAADLAEAARKIAAGQLQVIARFNDQFNPTRADFDVLPTPEKVRVQACLPEGITQTATRYQWSDHETLTAVIDAVDAYQKIYEYTL